MALRASGQVKNSQSQVHSVYQIRERDETAAFIAKGQNRSRKGWGRDDRGINQALDQRVDNSDITASKAFIRDEARRHRRA